MGGGDGQVFAVEESGFEVSLSFNKSLICISSLKIANDTSFSDQVVFYLENQYSHRGQ